jgi:hypothetical protein
MVLPLSTLLLLTGLNTIDALEADGGFTQAIRAGWTLTTGTTQAGLPVRVPPASGQGRLLRGLRLGRLVHDKTNLPKNT